MPPESRRARVDDGSVVYLPDLSKFIDLNETASSLYEELASPGATLTAVVGWCDREYNTGDQSEGIVLELISDLAVEGLVVHLTP